MPLGVPIPIRWGILHCSFNDVDIGSGWGFHNMEAHDVAGGFMQDQPQSVSKFTKRGRRSMRS